MTILDVKLVDKLIKSAESLWNENIRETSRGRCPEMLERNGWGWAIKKHPDYCGHTLGVIGRKAGIIPSLCEKTFPSTDRLANRVDTGIWRPVDPLKIDSSDLCKGDVVCVNPTDERPWGTHIVLCVAIGRKDLFYTIEGNSYGMIGDGGMGRGVVRKSRRRSSIARIYRLKESHFEG